MSPRSVKTIAYPKPTCKQDKKVYEKELAALSRQLANEEYNHRQTHQNCDVASNKLGQERNLLEIKIGELERELETTKIENDAIKSKNNKLKVRLETVNKYIGVRVLEKFRGKHTKLKKN